LGSRPGTRQRRLPALDLPQVDLVLPILTLGVSLLMATASAHTTALDRYTINGGGGTVKFKQSGESAEALSITKPLDLQALGGPVTIGR
jgi:hypothetical protein